MDQPNAGYSGSQYGTSSNNQGNSNPFSSGNNFGSQNNDNLPQMFHKVRDDLQLLKNKIAQGTQLLAQGSRTSDSLALYDNLKGMENKMHGLVPKLKQTGNQTMITLVSDTTRNLNTFLDKYEAFQTGGNNNGGNNFDFDAGLGFGSNQNTNQSNTQSNQNTFDAFNNQGQNAPVSNQNAFDAFNNLGGGNNPVQNEGSGSIWNTPAANNDQNNNQTQEVSLLDDFNTVTQNPQQQNTNVNNGNDLLGLTANTPQQQNQNQFSLDVDLTGNANTGVPSLFVSPQSSNIFSMQKAPKTGSSNGSNLQALDMALGGGSMNQNQLIQQQQQMMLMMQQQMQMQQQQIKSGGNVTNPFQQAQANQGFTNFGSQNTQPQASSGITYHKPDVLNSQKKGNDPFNFDLF